MKLVFMGTPDFAVGALEAIIKAGHDVRAVYTQPDKPKGRSGQMQFSPVKECALKYSIPVYQPERIKSKESVEELKLIDADIFVVAAFGQILSKEILGLPRFGCVNIHASLLPKYRGASPINWCILEGESRTGITIMQMNEGCDTGDILAQCVVPIEPKETGGSLFEKLGRAGAELIVDTLPKIERGELTPIVQNESEATHVGKLDKAMGRIDFSRDAASIERLVRGLNPWPSAYTRIMGKTLKIWDCDVINDEALQEETLQEEKLQLEAVTECGTVIAVSKDYFDIKCGVGAVRVREVQLEGKKRMDSRTFLLGYHMERGMKCGMEA